MLKKKKKAFGDKALGQTPTYKWFSCFKNEWMSVNDERSEGQGYPGRPEMNDSPCVQRCQTVAWNVPVNSVRQAQQEAHCSKICAKADE